MDEHSSSSGPADPRAKRHSARSLPGKRNHETLQIPRRERAKVRTIPPLGSLVPSQEPLVPRKKPLLAGPEPLLTREKLLLARPGPLLTREKTVARGAGTIAHAGKTIAREAGTIAHAGKTVAREAGTIAPEGKTIHPHDGTIDPKGPNMDLFTLRSNDTPVVSSCISPGIRTTKDTKPHERKEI